METIFYTKLKVRKYSSSTSVGGEDPQTREETQCVLLHEVTLRKFMEEPSMSSTFYDRISKRLFNLSGYYDEDYFFKGVIENVMFNGDDRCFEYLEKTDLVRAETMAKEIFSQFVFSEQYKAGIINNDSKDVR